MKNNIKTILAALIMMLSGAVTVMADINNPQSFIKFTKIELSAEECYFEFEYPDYNFEMRKVAKKDAAKNISFSIYTQNTNNIILATMSRCHDKMQRQNTDWGAVQIIRTRNVDPDTGAEIKQKQGDDPKGVRIVTVRYYPSCMAMENLRYIYVHLYWDEDDNDDQISKMLECQGQSSQLFTNQGFENYPKYDESGQSGSLSFDGANFHLNNYNLGNKKDYSGWTRKVRICDNANNALWGKTYFDGDVSANGSYNLTNVPFSKEVTLYAWNYLTRDIRVKNGSYHASEADVTVHQKATLKNPLTLTYMYNSGTLNGISLSRGSICGKTVITVSGNAKKADLYTALKTGYNDFSQLTYIGSVDMKSGSASYTYENDNPFSTTHFVAIPSDPSWTGRGYLVSSLHQCATNNLMNDGFDGAGTEASPYIIKNADDFSRMRICVNNGRKTKAHWILNSDIAFAKAPHDFNLMFETGTEAHPFDGVFDGNGHVITVSVGDNNIKTRALFGYIRDAVIKNLKVTGTINAGQMYCAGLASRMYGSSISCCWSDVTINSTVINEAGHGGFVGYAETTPTQISKITDCMFTGSLNGSRTYGCGGFVGWSQDKSDGLDIFSCMNLGTYTINNSLNEIFARNGAHQWNCFFIVPLSPTNASKLDDSYKDIRLINALGPEKYIFRAGEYPALKIFFKGLPDFVLNGSSVLRTNMDHNVTEMVFNRNFYAGERCTIMLPFDVDAAKAAEMGKFYTYSKILPASGRVVFTPVSGGLKANTPYVMEAAQSISSLTFNNFILKSTSDNPDASQAPSATMLVGTTKPVTAPTGAYGYSAGDATHDRGSFVKVGTNVTLPAFCAYLWINGGTAKTMEAVFTDEDGDITGIETLYQDEENPSIYSLDGRKLDRPERGINIINGKKVIIK